MCFMSLFPTDKQWESNDNKIQYCYQEFFYVCIGPKKSKKIFRVFKTLTFSTYF